MTDHKPNLGNARQVTQIDCPAGVSVTAWRLTKGGEGVVEVVRATGTRKPDVRRLSERELTGIDGWALVTLLQSGDPTSDFILTPTDVTPLVNAIQLAVRALKDNPATVAEDEPDGTE